MNRRETAYQVLKAFQLFYKSERAIKSSKKDVIF